MSSKLSRLLLILPLFVNTTAWSKSTAASAEVKEFVIALKPDKNPDQMISERTLLEAELTKSLSRKVKVIIPTSSAVILQGFANGTIDIGYLSSLDMVNAENVKAAEVLLAGEINGKTSYESLWLVKSTSTLKSVDDLKNKQVAFASRTSTSGFLIPYWDLIVSGKLKPKESADKYFSSVWYGTGYVSAVQKVLDGTVEAAAVSDYVYLGDKHLTAEEKAQLKILDRQGPVPTHVIASRLNLNPADRLAIKKALLLMNEKNMDLRDKLFTSKLVEVDQKKHLFSTRDALLKTGIAIEIK